MAERDIRGRQASFQLVGDGGRLRDRTPGHVDRRSPTRMVLTALTNAAMNRPPYPMHPDGGSFRTTLLGKLGLAGKEPDQRELGERFIDTGDGIGLGIFGDSDALSEGFQTLISAAHAGKANPHQDQLGRDLAFVAATQFRREGIVDPMVAELILMSPDRYLEEQPGIRQAVFEADFADAVMLRGGTTEDAGIVARAIQQALGFLPVDKTAEPEVPAGAVFIQRRGSTEVEPFTVEGVEMFTEERRHYALAMSSGALGDYWLESPSNPDRHRLIDPTR
ncbi:MAG TPA: hypothetical protein VND99_05495 [Candidatus Acidoferrales bacterium]|nr:hypothetical protein [Candidatus Acidoferrales bacterium]